MRKASVNAEWIAGQDVVWRSWGGATGAPLLALHCALGQGTEWAGLQAALPGCAIQAPDLAGHGRMPAWDGSSDLHGQSTALARALAGHLGKGRAIDVIGHSFGGTVALRLALETPQLVRRLTLVEPVIFAAGRQSPAWEAFREDHARIEARFSAGDRMGALEDFLGVWGAGEDPGRRPAALTDYMRARIGLVMRIDAALVADEPDLVAPGRLERLSCPVLLVEGGASPAIIAAVQDELARRLPHARRATIPGAGHMAPVTHPAALAAEVGSFLA